MLLLAGGLPVLETSNVSDRLNDGSLDAVELAVGLAARIDQSVRYKEGECTRTWGSQECKT